MRALFLPVCLLVLSSCSCATVREAASQPAPDGKATVTKADGSLVYAVGTRIQAPREAVWKVLADRAGYMKWNTTLVSLEGELAPGKKVMLVPKAAPDQTFALTVSEMTSPEKMVWEDGMPMGLFAGVRTFRLRSEADGSTVFTMSEVFSGPMLGMIEGSLPDQRPAFEGFAADLKRKVEADVPQAAAAPAEPAAAAPVEPAAPAATP